MKNLQFIKADIPFRAEFSYDLPAPQFRKKFAMKPFKKAVIYVAGLGIGNFWLNGRKFSDLFISAVSDYRKTVWYHRYDVTEFLREGENVLAIWCGNGFYNENFDSAWGHNKAAWRDFPKCAVLLEADGKPVLSSDETFKVKPYTAVTFNQYRSGEYFDAGLWEENWLQSDYDDGAWQNAVLDDAPPAGRLRECRCEPIRECGEFRPVRVLRNGEKYVFDFGQNIAGYFRVCAEGEKGETLTFRMAEDIDENNGLLLHGLGNYYPTVPFQTAKLTLAGKPVVWTPQFTYYGFRYIEAEGLKKEPDGNFITALFVHQDLRRTADFSCSDDFLNRVYRCAMYATQSNLFYALTDCPTREKLGWTNDAVATAEQLLINFDARKLLEKWFTDILDTMRPDGSVAGIAPSPDWGYDMGYVTDCALFLLPVCVYRTTGRVNMLRRALAPMKKYYAYYRKKTACEDAVFPLGDWNGNGSSETPFKFIEDAYAIIFCECILFASERTGRPCEGYAEELAALRERFTQKYFEKDGRCSVGTDTALAIAICLGLSDKEVLAEQFVALLEKTEFVQKCGMVGTQFIYRALEKIDRQDLILKIIEHPQNMFAYMLSHGATALWETYDISAWTISLNHHMFSNIVAWFTTGILGLKRGPESITVEPYYPKSLGHACGYIVKDGKKTQTEWRRQGDAVVLRITVPEKVPVYYGGERLQPGVHEFTVRDEK